MSVSNDGRTVSWTAYDPMVQNIEFTVSKNGGYEEIFQLIPDNRITGWNDRLLISSDGDVVAGTYREADFDWRPISSLRAYRWSTSSGFQTLRTLRADGGGESYISNMTPDGAVLIGGYESGSRVMRAYRWTTASGMEDLAANLPQVGSSQPDVLTRDGAVIAGSAVVDGATQLFRWSAGAGMQLLGGVPGISTNSIRSEALSGDGSVIVGRFRMPTAPGYTHAFRWDMSTGITDMGTLMPGNAGESGASGVSRDGRVIIGITSSPVSFSRVFRWTAKTGMTDIGSLRSDGGGQVRNELLSADGRVITGWSETDSGVMQAFRWTVAGGMKSLGALVPWGRSVPTAINDDGTIIVGLSDAPGGVKTFIWRTTAGAEPEAEGEPAAVAPIQDFGNLLASFGLLAERNAIVVSARQESARRMIGAGAMLADAGRLAVQIGGSLPFSGGPLYPEPTGTVAMGFGALDGLTLGATLPSTSTRPDTGSLWLRYSGSGGGTGLQATAGVFHQPEELSWTRGEGLRNVSPAQGAASLATMAAGAEVGYGVGLGGWLLTPKVNLESVRVERDGYAEVGSSFNASYDTLRAERRTLSLSLDTEYIMGPWGNVLAGYGRRQQLHADPVVLSGRSDIPGLQTFAIPAAAAPLPRRDFAHAGYRLDVGPGSLKAILWAEQDPFGTGLDTSLDVSLGVRF